MPMLTRRKMFLYKVETTKGTDAVPVAASDLILPNNDINIQITTEQDTGESELKSTFGPGDSVTVKQAMSLEIVSRVRGLGQGVGALVTPAIHPLLIASGHAVATAGNGTSTPREATYTPTSVAANLKSASGYFYEDGLLYKLLGAVNTLSFEASMSALTVKGTVQAPYLVPTVAALPSFTAPTQKIYRMTSALAVINEAGSPVNIGAFTFDAAPKVEEDYVTGNHSFDVFDRSPSISIDPLAVAAVTDWTRLTNATSIAIVATFTNELGETLVFHAPKAVPMEISSQDRAGRITRQKKYSLKETAGDDSYSIKWTAVL